MSCHHTLEVVLPLNSIHYQMMVALPLNSIHYQMMVDLPSNPTKKANPFNDQSLVRHMDRLLVLQSSDQTQMSTVGVLSTAGLHVIYFQLRRILRMVFHFLSTMNSILYQIQNHWLEVGSNLLPTAYVFPPTLKLNWLASQSNSHRICLDKHYGYADEQAAV
ncbi:hypothetical protein V6N11_039540 [Hibiscus sabdariffa]|uniref:Uncharacterized protein n=1 Tax=Hibiscus sabdariffa TaxID=183260 RepID=A0ABR2SNX7_9ROSI